VDGLNKSSRTEAGKPGGVIQVIYLAAFALGKGQSLLGMLGGNYLPWMKVEVCLFDFYVLSLNAGPTSYVQQP
jgi:hypothetical protein